jgi:carboxylesterase type B
VAFARTGDPNRDSRARWRRYNATEDNLINFTNSGAVQAKVPRAAVLDVIASSYMP